MLILVLEWILSLRVRNYSASLLGRVGRAVFGVMNY
jgi:hypothetical protein